MMRLFVIAAVLVVVAAAAHGQTHITGDITWSTTWSPGCGPYIIQADVQVTGNSTLSIDAGVTVAFDGNYVLGTEWGSAIIATGVSGNGVLFTSNAGTPAPGDWTWVQVNGPNPSSFSYCTFEYAQMGLRANVADPTISHCTIRNSSSSGVFCASGSPTVQYCDIYANRDGIGISSGETVSNPTINYNNIYGNTHWNVYVFSFPEPAATIDCENNWWGTDVEAEIANEIRDSADNPDIYVTIDYTPWWVEQPVEELTWGRVKALFVR